jgi:hypothetical protein
MFHEYVQVYRFYDGLLSVVVSVIETPVGAPADMMKCLGFAKLMKCLVALVICSVNIPKVFSPILMQSILLV